MRPIRAMKMPTAFDACELTPVVVRVSLEKVERARRCFDALTPARRGRYTLTPRAMGAAS